MISACSEEHDCCENIVSNSYQVKLINADGVNLLDPASPGAINISQIRQFIVENGTTRMVDNTGQGYIPDSPYGVNPIMLGEEHAISFSFLYEGDEMETTSIIQWNQEKTDTLNFNFNTSGYPSYLTKISQGQDVWILENDVSPITITLTY